MIGKEAESELSENGTTGGSNLDGGIGICWNLALVHCVCVVNVSDHDVGEVDGEDIVGIREETDSSDDDSTNVIP